MENRDYYSTVQRSLMDTVIRSDSKANRQQRSVSDHQLVIQQPERKVSRDETLMRERQIFKDALMKQQQWVVATIEKYVGRISKDIEKISGVLMRQDTCIQKLYSSHRKLDKSYLSAIEALVERSDSWDDISSAIIKEIKLNTQRICELKMHNGREKKQVNKSYIENNTEYILEICKIRDEMELLKMTFKKEIAASDERRRISMDGTRYRLQTSNSYTKNAFKVWKLAVLTSLNRTERTLLSRLKEDKTQWKMNMDTFERKTTEELERLDQGITVVEEEAKLLIQGVVKKLEDLEKTVDADCKTNEDFRKVARSYMASRKTISDRHGEDSLSIANQLKTKSLDIETQIKNLKDAMEIKITKFSEETKNQNEIVDKQIQYLSRQVRILLLHCSKQSL